MDKIKHQHARGDALWQNFKSPGRTTLLQKDLLRQINGHPMRGMIRINQLLELLIAPQKEKKDTTMHGLCKERTAALDAIIVILDVIQEEVSTVKRK